MLIICYILSVRYHRCHRYTIYDTHKRGNFSLERKEERWPHGYRAPIVFGDIDKIQKKC